MIVCMFVWLELLKKIFFNCYFKTKNCTQKMDAADKKQAFQDIRQQVEDLTLNRDRVKEIAQQTVENLVFEGGGIRGLAFGGVVRFLEEHSIVEHVKGVAGSSAGAIFAAGLAVGYTAQEMINLLTETNFESFKDDSWGVVFDLIRLLTQYGVYKGDAFYNWFANVLEKKTGNAKITFRQVYERYGKTLVITGSCLNRAQTYYFNHTDEKYADMPIALAVRISMSIPFLYKAVRLGDDVMVDGGVLNNYPLFVFDGKRIGDSNVTDEEIAKSKTVGFKLMTSNERTDGNLYNVNEKVEGPIDFTKAFINATLIQIERGHIRSGYWDRTVCINTHEISSLDFNLEPTKKALLVHEGYIATKNYFHCKIEGVENAMNRCIWS